MYTEEVNKVAISSDDDKGLQTFNRNEPYLYGTPACIVCKSESLMVFEAKQKLKIIEEKFETQSNECESEMYAKEKKNMKCFQKILKRDAKKKCESI